MNSLRNFARSARVAALGIAVFAVCLAAARPFAAAQGLDDERPPGQRRDEESARSGDDEGPVGPVEPLRILTTVGAGGTLRIVNDLALEQGRFAPPFVDLAAGIVLPGRGLFRHGVHLQASANLSGEGPGVGSVNEAVGIDAIDQWTVTPSYLAYLRLSDTLVVTGRAGVNLTVSPYFIFGGEVAAGALVLFTAGLGLYTEASFNLAFGEAPEPLPTASLEVGLAIDYEVLP